MSAKSRKYLTQLLIKRGKTYKSRLMANQTKLSFTGVECLPCLSVAGSDYREKKPASLPEVIAKIAALSQQNIIMALRK